MTKPLIFDIETHSANERYYHKPNDFFRLGGSMSLDSGQVVWIDHHPQVFRAHLQASSLVIGHNILAFDLPALGGFDLLQMTRDRKILDTWTMATVLDPPPAEYVNENGVTIRPWKPEQYKSYYKLDNLAFQYGVQGKVNDLRKLAEAVGDPNACCTFGTIPAENREYRDYLIGDVNATRAVLGNLLARGLTDYVWREQRVAAVMSQISQNGFRLDRPEAQRRVDAQQVIREANLKWLIEEQGLPIYKADGKTLAKSPASTKEGKESLYRTLLRLGVRDEDVPRTNKGAPSFGGDGLKELAKKYAGNVALEATIDVVAGLQGLRTVYQTAIDNVHADGFVHPDIFTLQASGRSSVQDPGLTVFGKRGGRHKEREIFLPDNDEECLFAVDLSQVDARAVAAQSQDHAYMDLFAPGRDLHLENARNVWGRAAVDANPKLRDMAKIIGHGWNYNMGFAKLAAIPGVGEAMARQFMDAMERNYPRLIAWKAESVMEAERYGVLHNGFGRVMKANRDRAFTQGPALRGQGAARDIAMEGVLKMDDSVVRMMKAFIHDEFIFSAPIKVARDAKQHAIECFDFEWAPPGAIRPIKIVAEGTKFGLNWGDLYA